MSFEEIGKYYSSKEKYERELDDSSIDFNRLLIETVEWKIPNLMHVIPANFVPETVAEIGCFTGHLIGNILINGQKKFKRFGYDANLNAINKAKMLYSNTQFFCEDPLVEKKHIFDLLILSDIVEHIEDDVNFLISCKHLSDKIVINLPLEKSIANFSRAYGLNDPSGHLRAYNLRDALILFEQSGFKVQRMFTSCIVNSQFNQKRLELLSELQHIQKNSLIKQKLKENVKKFLQKSYKFNELYYGTNLFAFLVDQK